MKKRYWYVDCSIADLGMRRLPRRESNWLRAAGKPSVFRAGKEDMYATAVLLAEGVE